MKNYLKHLTPLGVLVGSLCLAVIFLACVLVGKLDPPKTADSGFPPAGVGSEAATKRSGRTGPPPLVAPGPAALDQSSMRRGEVSHARSTDPAAVARPRCTSTDQAGLRLSPELYRVTAYCPCELCCGAEADGITASGLSIDANGGRFAAADPAVPFGTVWMIPGYGTVPVLDRGEAVRGNHLDVFFPTHAEAMTWGVQWLDVSAY